MRVARITKCTCDKCGHQAELLVKAEHDWRRPCDSAGCDGTMHMGGGGTQRFYGNRRFAGEESESITEGFHPDEVETARKHIGPECGQIRDNGTVAFDDRAQQKRYMRRLESLGWVRQGV